MPPISHIPAFSTDMFVTSWAAFSALVAPPLHLTSCKTISFFGFLQHFVALSAILVVALQINTEGSVASALCSRAVDVVDNSGPSLLEQVFVNNARGQSSFAKETDAAFTRNIITLSNPTWRWTTGIRPLFPHCIRNQSHASKRSVLMPNS